MSDCMSDKRIVAIYARVSTEHEAQISALENQVQYYDELLSRHPEWELYEKYIDEGITGTSVKKRQSFMRMMKDAEDGKFDLIITREVSRFARNTVDTLQQTRLLKKQGVEVYFTEDNIWTMNDEDGELRLTIMATLAQNESKKTSQRVKAGQKISFENGVLYGNGNILGYDRVGKELRINEEQAKTVRMIFDLYLQGNGVATIRYGLQAAKRLTATGLTEWQPGTISRILKNAFYCGLIVYRKQYVPDYLEQKKINNFGDVDQIIVEGTHEPIVTREEYQKVQAIMRVNSTHLKSDETGKKRRGIKRSPDVWCRKLKCECGSTFNRVKWHTGQNKPDQYAYQCYGQIKSGSIKTRIKKGLSIEGICGVKVVPKWKLEAMADVIFQKFWTDRQSVITICNEMLDTCMEADDDNPSIEKRRVLQQKMESWDNRYNNLLDMRMNGEIEKDRYDEKREALLKEQKELKRELDILDEDDLAIEISDGSDEAFQDKIKLLKCGLEHDFQFSTKNLPDDIIELFVDEIIVCKDCFIWKLNISANDSIMKVDGRVNKFEVSQTELEKGQAEKIYSDIATQHRLQLPRSRRMLFI